MRHIPKRTSVNLAILGIMAMSAAHSGGFSLYTEDSAAAIGNYAAGIAAEAGDASIGWYNPAGLVLLSEQQLVLGGVGILPSANLTGTSTFTTLGLPDYVQTFNNINGGDNAFVPSFHYALPLGPRATFGISAVSPFGLATEWSPYSPVRYQATFSELLTTNVSPELGVLLSDHFSAGAGLDLQYARVRFNQMIGLPTLFVPFFPANTVDTLSYNSGNSFGVGFHAGLMAMFNDNHTRIGVNYQSEMNHRFHGQSRLVGPLASPGLILADPASLADANFNAVFKTNSLSSDPIVLPNVITLSAYQDLNEQFALLGSLVYTGWSSFKTIGLNNVAAPAINPLTTEVSQIAINAVTQQEYSDVWRVAAGANYRVNPLWMIRVGGGYDATPTNNLFRDVRLPDVNRWALSAGVHYQPLVALGFDAGYTHIFSADSSRVNRTEAIGTTASFNVNAISKADVDLVGAQVVWTIDKVVVDDTK